MQLVQNEDPSAYENAKVFKNKRSDHKNESGILKTSESISNQSDHDSSLNNIDKIFKLKNIKSILEKEHTIHDLENNPEFNVYCKLSEAFHSGQDWVEILQHSAYFQF